MPNKIPTVRRPWEPEQVDYNAMQGQGRLVVNKFYHTTAWKMFRDQHIALEPLCRECLKNGETKEGKIVDHIQPINPANSYDTQDGKWGEPLDHNNCQSLCNHHNAVKTGKDRKRK